MFVLHFQAEVPPGRGVKKGIWRLGGADLPRESWHGAQSWHVGSVDNHGQRRDSPMTFSTKQNGHGCHVASPGLQGDLGHAKSVRVVEPAPPEQQVGVGGDLVQRRTRHVSSSCWRKVEESAAESKMSHVRMTPFPLETPTGRQQCHQRRDVELGKERPQRPGWTLTVSIVCLPQHWCSRRHGGRLS